MSFRTPPPGVVNTWQALPDLPDLPDTDQPKTRAIAATIESAIQQGAFRQGQRLPGYGHIGRRYGVDRMTARDAVRLLADRGLVRIAGTHGTFVRGTEAGR